MLFLFSNKIVLKNNKFFQYQLKACQKTQTRPSTSNLIGDQDSSSFSYDGGVFKITYTSSPYYIISFLYSYNSINFFKLYFYLRRTTYLTCKCSKSESFSFDGESPQNTYVE